MENELYAYFDDNPTYGYPIVMGAVYSEEFNETIDSFSITLDKVDSEHRIDLSKPYHIVKIVNKGTNGFRWKGYNYIFMYTNSTVIEETNIDKKYYSYSIGLMNIIKALENIQCPNLVITHDLRQGSTRKTIYEYIDMYMQLYCPKIKQVSNFTNEWSYRYLFTWQNLDRHPFNDTICADMQLNAPTLRDLLTNLMTQVDCIPTLDFRDLWFINFRDEPTTFEYVDNGVNYFNLSNASDSYVNQIVQEPSQVLDEENYVYSEQVGFRDNNSYSVRQLDNLMLNTRFPIYKIKEVKISRNYNSLVYMPLNIFNDETHNTFPYPIIGSYNSDEYLEDGRIPEPIIFNNNVIRINILYSQSQMHKGILSGLKAHICSCDANWNYTEICVATFGDISWNLNFGDTSANTTVNRTGYNNVVAQKLNSDGTLGEKEYTATNRDVIFLNCYNYYAEIPFSSQNGATHIWFEFTWVDMTDNKSYYCFYPVVPLDVYTDDYFANVSLIANCRWSLGDNGEHFAINKYYLENYNEMHVLSISEPPVYVDITPCFVEKSKRNLLETNYANMPSHGTMEELARWLYGTVEYSIGGNQITGFSQMYNFAQGWWNRKYTFIDNIITYINASEAQYPGQIVKYTQYDYTKEPFVKYRQLNANMPISNLTVRPLLGFDYPGAIPSVNKVDYLFFIKYYPINSFKMKWSKKEDFDYPIERLNNLESGLGEFSRLSKKAQSTIDRIGNAILTITQTTDNASDIQPVNSNYTDANGKVYTIFKRQISINEKYLSATYYASEKYVMKNYFTSIITKYRAYQYVDYSASVLRKENRTIYCLLAKDYYIDGDDKLNCIDNSFFVLGCLDNSDIKKSLRYNVEKSMNYYLNGAGNAYTSEEEAIRNDIVCLSYEDGFSIVSQDYDNVSAGIFLPTGVMEANMGVNMLLITGQQYVEGVRQQWQMWNQDVFNEKHYMYYAYLMVNYSQTVDDDLTQYNKLPIISKGWEWEDYIVLQLCNDKTQNDEYVFYKDLAEVINFTLQFEFYTNDDDICWCRNFFKNSPLLNQSNYIPNCVVKITNLDDFTCYTDLYLSTTYYRSFLSSNINDFVEVGKNENNVAYIKVKWSEIDSSVDAFAISYTNGVAPVESFVDFIAFKRNNATQDVYYYLSFNDSKNNTAWKIYQTGDYAGLFERLKCKSGLNRIVEENE